MFHAQAQYCNNLKILSGCTQQEINKLTPKAEDRRKYNKRTLSSESLIKQSSKRARLDPSMFMDDEDIDSLLLTPQEANEQFILENLTLEKAVYLIFTHIPKLPSSAPTEFIRDYEIFVAQGNIGKIHLANVLAQQFIETKVGPGVQIEAKQKAMEAEKKKREKEEEIKNEKVAILNCNICYVFEYLFLGCCKERKN